MDNNIKITLNETKNISSVNETNTLKVNLLSSKKLISKSGSLTETLSLYELYNKERDNCDKFRLIFTINPICSNILFNGNTEIVIYEGSDNCKCLNYESVQKPEEAVNTTSTVDVRQAIKDTEYSNENRGNFTYHCCPDIFNNHMLRSIGFQCMKTPSVPDDSFNTISGKIISNNGGTVSEVISLTGWTGDSSIMHMYNLDNIKAFKTAYREGIRENDGWYGFYNVGTLKFKGNEINRTIENKKKCEFIDFYPDRTLFSFIPKVNTYRNRVEKNWDCILTYPYENDSKKLEEIGITDSYGYILISDYEAKETISGSYVIMVKTVVRHTLQKNDFVSIIISNSGKRTKPIKCIVIQTGDDNGKGKDIFFKLRYQDLSHFVDTNDILSKTVNFSYKKMNNMTECSYYLRKFKKLGDYSFDINKLMGGKNIYGDNLAQLIFIDDIDIPFSVKNNLGMPLTDIYLTFVKRNAGHDEWYINHDVNNEKIEFSHCFGDVCSGLMYGSQSEFDIRNQFTVSGEYNANGKQLDSGITEESYSEGVYGDVIEFDQSTYTESVLLDVYHRFNTMQRELTGLTIYYDELVSDDYMPNENGVVEGFKVEERTIENSSFNPEGYLYKPNHKVKLRELSKINKAKFYSLISPDKNRTDFTISKEGNLFKVDTITPNYLLDFGRKMCLIDIYGNVKFCNYAKFENEHIYLDGEDLEGIYEYLLKLDKDCPAYSKLNWADRCFVWRDIVAYSECDDQELKDMPFSNGALYKHLNINFFLMRQDPTGEYASRYVQTSSSLTYIKPNKSIDTSEAEYFYNDLNYTCY